MATLARTLAWEILWQRSLAGYSPWGRKKVGHNLATKQQQPHDGLLSQRKEPNELQTRITLWMNKSSRQSTHSPGSFMYISHAGRTNL